MAVMLGLYVVMPKMLIDEARDVLRPQVLFLVFAYFCIFQIPYLFL
jgi:hypothetical protein